MGMQGWAQWFNSGMKRPDGEASGWLLGARAKLAAS